MVWELIGILRSPLSYTHGLFSNQHPQPCWLEKIPWEGEFTLRSDPWAGLIASCGSFYLMVPVPTVKRSGKRLWTGTMRWKLAWGRILTAHGYASKGVFMDRKVKDSGYLYCMPVTHCVTLNRNIISTYHSLSNCPWTLSLFHTARHQ